MSSLKARIKEVERELLSVTGAATTVPSEVGRATGNSNWDKNWDKGWGKYGKT